MLANITAIAVMLMCVFLVIAVPTLMLYRRGARVPPCLVSSRYRSGFGGPIVFFLMGEVAVVERLLWEGYQVTRAIPWHTIEGGVNQFAALVSVGPFFIQAALGCIMLATLIFCRRPVAVASCILFLWLMGPVAVLLTSWYFSLKAPVLGLVEIFGWSLIWTAYFVLSPRVALTYGTPRGERLAREYAEKKAVGSDAPQTKTSNNKPNSNPA